MTQETLKDRLDRLMEFGQARGFERVIQVEDFPQSSRLDIPLNDPDTGDHLTVAELSVEDSGYGPAIWALGLAAYEVIRSGQLVALDDPKVVGLVEAARKLTSRKPSPATGGRMILETDCADLERALAAFEKGKSDD